MSESIYLIYKHTSPSGKSYIGQTKDYDRRCWQHQTEHSKCRAFSAAIKKYGWDNFTHEMLVENITEDEANTLEVFYIKEYQAFGPNGYNLTSGGNACVMSDETKSKISIAAMGRSHSDETKAKLSAANTGKVQSPETIAKRMLAVIGRKNSDETKAKMSAASKGKPKSAEHKAKISESLKGTPQSEETKAKRKATRLANSIINLQIFL